MNIEQMKELRGQVNSVWKNAEEAAFLCNLIDMKIMQEIQKSPEPPTPPTETPSA